MGKKATWVNRKRMYRGQKCSGSYVWRGTKDRELVLKCEVTGVRHYYNSHEAAKKSGWYVL